jgi:formamidopyrimidine-DNA glycosylase
VEIHRRGKYLILEMEPRLFWLIHLGMSGRLIYASHAMEAQNHTHCTIGFAGGGELQFCDPRRFGLIDVYQVPCLDDVPEMQRLGKDPLGEGFSAGWLWAELGRTRRDLKSFLLDQHKIAGLGNIYVCEALFRAHLHPQRRCNTVEHREAVALARAVDEVLRAAVQNRGTSFSDFMDSDGELGAHQNFLHVFQREGEKCRRCRAHITRIRQGNRSTYFCPRCQDGASKGKKGGSRDRRL